MLKNTFLHIPGIGSITEQRLWNSGIKDWDATFDNTPIPISANRKITIIKVIEESIHHLDRGNPAFFANLLPSNQCWRIFPEFRELTVYLDIETTGLERNYNDITTIALYDGATIKTYVHGQNLDAFVDDIQKYNVIVSYNGKSFDVPFIENYFGIQLSHAQIDLRYVLGSLDCKGGLKSCERQLGMDRGDLSDVDGFFAVLLWNEYRKTGNKKALDTLLAYNVQDTVNLEYLMVTAYNMKLKATPFYHSHQISLPRIPMNPYTADLKTVDRIKYGSGFMHSNYW
ncbi:MAG: ribonuclease H-like domain-containing protein [Nitrospinales bacterium]